MPRRTLAPALPAALALVALVVPASPALARWGADINAGMGPQLILSVREDLAALVRAPEAERPALVQRIVERHGLKRIEALKRFRNPELRPLFMALLGHDDWTVCHRALFVLEYYGATEALPRAWELLGHPNRRMRERAAIALIKLWDGNEPRGALDKRLRVEEDFHVRCCLEALARRKLGRLTVDRVAQEYVLKDPDGLVLTPFLEGMDKLGQVAPGAQRKGEGRTGGGSASRLPPAERFTTPILGYGEEEVSGVSLQPFGNPRAGGSVLHTGQDVGACLDGAGYYAIADGIVKFVFAGTDLGTLICTEHHLPGGGLVTAVYMHGGDTVFVEPGDRVACGQLIGTMGMGYSIENGGHYAHLHFGLYPGPFDVKHNFGYRAASAGLSDWYDPARFLPAWVERTVPLVPRLRPVDRALARAADQMRTKSYGAAYAALVRARDVAEPGSDVHADAVYLATLVQRVPDLGLARATRLRDGGYPRLAAAQLKDLATRCRGVPGSETLAQALDAWENDPLFRKAVKGVGRFDTTVKRAARAKDATEARALWTKLLDEYGDTCLRPRIEQHLR